MAEHPAARTHFSEISWQLTRKIHPPINRYQEPTVRIKNDHAGGHDSRILWCTDRYRRLSNAVQRSLYGLIAEVLWPVLRLRLPETDCDLPPVRGWIAQSQQPITARPVSPAVAQADRTLPF